MQPITRRTALGAAAGWSLYAAAATPSLKPPASGNINVAFLLNRGATVIDFCGPWEVFQDVMFGDANDHSSHRMPFRLYTVAERKEPVRCSAGLQVMPDHTFETAPPPQVVVIPAQAPHGEAGLAWLRKAHQTADVTMSVCTGAFVLGAAGLLDGLEATTHHDFFDQFAQRFPKAKLKRGLRFVENARISTAGGLTSGIDLALHVVDRYYGRQVAQRTADYMEYQSKGWIG